MSRTGMCSNCGNPEARHDYCPNCGYGDPLHAATESELERLRAELTEAQKDAERYRWLRNESWSLTHCGRKYPRVAQTVVITDPYMRVTLLAEEALDAAVDAAMGGGNG